MKLIHRGRMQGKTTELIRQCASIPGSVIVVHNTRESRRVVVQAKAMGLSIHTPLTYQEIMDGFHDGMGYTTLLIDNVDMLLQQLVGPTPIDTITLNRHIEIDEDTSKD